MGLDLDQFVPLLQTVLNPLQRQCSLGYRALHRANGLSLVPAVAKAATGVQLPDIDEALKQ